MQAPRDSPEASATAALLISAWLEPGSQPPLRARIRTFTGLDEPQNIEVVATRSEILSAVDRWLDELLDPDAGDTGNAAG